MRSLPYDDPGIPPTGRIPFLAWIARGQWRTLVGGMALGIIWALSQALIPATIARAIDEGIVPGDAAALWRWSGVLVALAALTALSGTGRHVMAVTNWLRASFRTIQLIGWHAARTGEALPRHTPTGDVVATVASDAMRIGGLYDVTARFVGGIVAYVVVAIILLRASLPLGLLVLIGVPVLVASLTFIVRPLQRRQALQREESGRLIGLGADTVTGLRVLRGIGGEQTFLRRYAAQSAQVRDVGYRVSGIQAALDAAQVLLPGIFALLVTWLGARFAVEGRITPGELVAFYGYTAFLVTPLRAATEFLDRGTRAMIGSRKILRVLGVRPDHADRSDIAADIPAPQRVSGAPALADERSGLVVRPHLLTMVVSARPEESAALADRLGGFGIDIDGACVEGIPVGVLPVEQLRARVLVSETEPRLFTGSLREELDPWGRRSDADILEALSVASGEDLLEALPDGLDSEVQERGRSFSGGQRQRIVLARALLAAPETLVLVEPTSAVDAHTEARIAGRLTQARRGRTTVIMTASPLLLDHADEVVLLEQGRVIATGTHEELLHRHPHRAAYRAVVVRGED